MNGEATFGAALVGALGYLVLQLLGPLSVGLGSVSLSLWLVPLIAVHLWPRMASAGASVLFILAIGFAADMMGGLRLGTSPVLGMVLFALVRPDRRPEEVGELRMWAVFTLLLAGLMALVAFVTGEWRRPLPLLLDVGIAVALFPVIFRLMRLVRGRTRESRELFP